MVAVVAVGGVVADAAHHVACVARHLQLQLEVARGAAAAVRGEGLALDLSVEVLSWGALRGRIHIPEMKNI